MTTNTRLLLKTFTVLVSVFVFVLSTNASKERKQSSNTTGSVQETWGGSTFNVSGNTSIESDELVELQGVTATGNNFNVDAKKVSITAGEENNKDYSSSSSNNQKVSFSTKANAVSGSAGFNKSNRETTGTNYVNSNIKVTNFKSKSDVSCPHCGH